MSDAGILAKPWQEMGADEKLEHRLDAWKRPVLSFASSEAGQAYAARVQRLIDAIRLEKEPDQVPVPLLLSEIYPLRWAGLSAYDGMYDFARGSRAFLDFTIEFQPDALVNPAIATAPGRVLDLIDYRPYSWPGHGVAKDSYVQYDEREWMTAEDYDRLIDSPGEFLMRRYLPDVSGALEGLTKLGNPFSMVSITGCAKFVATWGDPRVIEGLERAAAAGKEAAAWAAGVGEIQTQLKSQGFPALVAGSAKAPFDLLGDHLRGTKEMVLDLYRRPEKVLEACERLIPFMVDWALQGTTPETPPCLFWPLHKGDDAHMNSLQFETFYWPTLRAVALALIDEGFIPLFFAEGKMDSRLEVIAQDLPKGRTVWLLDRTDMAHAKATLGQVAALQGNVPLSLLATGTPEDVRQYCRRLIEVAAPGGGFLLDSGAVIYDAKEANVRAMIQAARDYGVYR
jgi:hypothetical protein